MRARSSTDSLAVHNSEAKYHWREAVRSINVSISMVE
jgi:hypothetical protein